jgi:uncharacterized membrane protein
VNWPELLAWAQNAIVAAIVTFTAFMSREVVTPLWLLLLVFMTGILWGKARGVGGRMSKAYQRIRVKFAR